MSDQFVNDLIKELTEAAGVTTAGAPGHSDSPHGPVEGANVQWWLEFIDILGQKVGAWNEQGASDGVVNFTRQEDGSAYIFHRSAEAHLTLEDDRIVAHTRFGAEPKSRRILLELVSAPDGTVVARADTQTLASPMAAAEHVIRPILVHAFQPKTLANASRRPH